MEHTSSQARIRRIDILRGIAVFGIMLINVWGFAFVSNYRYGVLPANASWLDQAVVFACAALAEFKFYPIFAFLFGAGFILQTDRLREGPGGLAETKRIYKRRLWWLFGCGFALGLLVFRGEILTAYALVGFWMLAKAAGRRTSELVRLLIKAASIAVVLSVILLALTLMTKFSPHQAAARLAGMYAKSDLMINGSWSAIMKERAISYLEELPIFLIMAPHVAACFMLGAVATRLGWLTRPERYRAGWRRVRLWGLLVGLPINLWIGWQALDRALHPLKESVAESTVFPLLWLTGPILTAGFVAHLMLFGPKRVIRWSKWLSPVGRMALTNYVAQAFLLAVLLQGTGFGLAKHLSHAGLVGLCFAIMAVQLVWSRRWLARHRQGPLEAVWRRYTFK